MPRHTKYKGCKTRRERKENRAYLEKSLRNRAPKLQPDTAFAQTVSDAESNGI